MGSRGARGFKKVWRGAGAFPGLAEGRRAQRRRLARSRRPQPRPQETLGAAVFRGTSRRAPRPGVLGRGRRLVAGPPRGASVPAAPELDARAALGARGGMERSAWAPRTCLLALLLGATLRARGAPGYYPRFSPFFFLCTHHGELEGDGEQGEVLISLHLAGNPTYYVPGQEYHGRYRSLAAPCRPVRPRARLLLLSFLQGAVSARTQTTPRNIALSGGRGNKVSGASARELGFIHWSPRSHPASLGHGPVLRGNAWEFLGLVAFLLPPRPRSCS